MLNEQVKEGNVQVTCSIGTSTEKGVDLPDALQKVANLEDTIAVQNMDMEKMNQQMTALRQSLEEKTIELNVMTANVSVLQEKLKSSGPKSLFARSADEELETETTKLRQQLDESNKTMIKCKLRIKQLQKQVDTFKKMSNVHEEVVRLTEQVSALSVDGAAEKRKNSCGTAEAVDEQTLAPETQKRIEMLELTCQNQATAMQLLEEQKNDLSEDLCRTRGELQTLSERMVCAEGGQIATQMHSIELDEQLEKCLADKTELTKVLHSWEAEKGELQLKLKQCLEENAELLGKIEKLSIEKVSSAESIEILENLTLHEKQEMEKSEKRALGQTVDEAMRRDSKEDLNESLVKLMEESKELMDKVEMFTDERREVLEKLDAISIENQANIAELDRLKVVNEQLQRDGDELASAKADLEEKLRVVSDEKESILHELSTVRERKQGDCAAPTSYTTTSSAVPQPNASVATESFQQALTAVENELVSYNKNKDKQKKLQVSKKLAANAKNLVTMSRQLVDDYGACLLERTVLCEQIATLSQQAHAVHHADHDKGAADRHELEAASERSSDDEPELLKVELNSKNEEIVALKRTMEAQAKAKSAEQLHLQQQLREAQDELHRLQERVAHADELQTKYEQLCTDAAAYREQVRELSAEVWSANEAVQRQMETCARAQRCIDGLTRQSEEYLAQRDAQTRRIEELTAQLDVKSAGEQSERAELEQKNQELLDKLKKFAANLKRKNVQCTELEQEIKQLTEENQRLMDGQRNQPAHEVSSEQAANEDSEAVQQLREENEGLAQKLHHLNNELHRLLEQKYQMEVECQTGRDERAALAEQLNAAQEQQAALGERVRALEQELAEQLAELEASRKELANRNVKIDKCKAIIKEKIKETHRLQEHERRTAYLEDELRMTQSKLEDFHNQTLLIGRLKGEKEELNAAVREEHEQRRRLEQQLDEQRQQLDEQRQQLAGAHEQERTVGEMLKQVEAWVRWFGDRWQHTSGRDDPPEVGSIAHLSEWCAVLTDTDECIARTLEEKTEALLAVSMRAQESEQIALKLRDEIAHTKQQLASVEYEREQQQDTIGRIRCELEQAQTDLDSALCSNKQVSQLRTELQAQHDRLQEANALGTSLQISLATSEQQNEELLRQIDQLRETVGSYEQAIQDIKLHAEELLSENESLKDELTLLRKQASALEQSLQQLRTEFDGCQREHEAALQRVQDEAQARETKLTEELRRRTAELDDIREEYDEQLTKDTQSKDQLGEVLRRKDEELEALRHELQEKQLEGAQAQDLLEDTLARMTREMDSLRAGFTEQLTEQVEARKQLSELLNAKEEELAVLQNSFDEQLQEKSQTSEQVNEAIRRKSEELEALRADCDRQLAEAMELKGQLEATLAQKATELETLRGAYEERLVEVQTQHTEQLADAVRRKDEELAAMRQRFDEQLARASAIPTKEQLDELQDAELEAVRQDYEAQLADVKHSKEQLNDALQRKDKELESLRKTYKECCEQQDLHARNHFQELSAQQQKLLESVGERVALQQTVDAMTRAADEQATEMGQLRARIASLERQTSENLTNTSILSTLNEALNEELDQLQERMVAGGEDRAVEDLLRQKNDTIEQLVAQQKLMQQEITDLKVKAGRLLRKLKETRARCDELEKATGSSADGWEVDAIGGPATPAGPSNGQLEANLKAAEEDRDRLRLERDALLAKLDTLEVACEKLTELKEHQDRQLELLRDTSQEHELRDRLQRATAALQTRESEVLHLTAQLEQLAGAADTVNALKARLSELESRAISAPAETGGAEQLVVELEQRNRLLETEKSEMGRELEALNQQILHDLQFEDRLHKAMLELDAKNVELQMLRSTLEQMHTGEGRPGSTDEPTPEAQQQQIAALEARVVELEQQKAAFEQQLETSAIEAVEYAQPEVRETAGDDAARVREVLERQELEIVTLKEQLAVRSAEYARLASHVDPTRLLGLINSGAATLPVPAGQPPSVDRDSRAELELALYMIYQRDMRCDELELELRNLLEERDALQLRLSNALRMHEEFRLKCATIQPAMDSTEYGTSGECSIESSPERPAVASTSTSAPPGATPSSSSAEDPRPRSSMSTAADSPDLSSKLSELHSISYSKEKRWQEEREDRNRQLTLIQRDLANMPLEAAAKIAGTEVTADADNAPQQSASSVLLNWILGKK